MSGTIVPVDGRAQGSTTQMYGLNSTYGLVVRIREDASTVAIAAQSSAAVVVGLSKKRLHP